MYSRNRKKTFKYTEIKAIEKTQIEVCEMKREIFETEKIYWM